MLSLFPIHRPSFGVAVGAHSVGLVAVRRLPFRRPTVTRVAERRLQTGWMTPSASAPNIANMDALEEAVRALTGPLRDRAAAISLPDEAATIGVFNFDKLPEQPQEREAVIRWRFQQEADLKVGRERLVYSVFRGDNQVSVLAAVAQDAVLSQYQALFNAARLLPVSVGFHTFQLFNVFRHAMPVSLERFFVHYNGETLTFLALLKGRPVFLRKRRLKPTGFLVRDELFGTLQYFDDRFPSPAGDGVPSPLCFIDTRPASAQAEPLFDKQTTITVPAVHHVRSVEVTPFDWRALPFMSGREELTGTLLLAAAGVGTA